MKKFCVVLVFFVFGSFSLSAQTDEYQLLVKRGEAFALLGNFDEAIAQWSKAITLNPDNAQAYFARGGIYLEFKKDLDRALADFNQVIRINPSHTAGYAYRGKTHVLKANYDRAIADLTQAIKLDPNNADAYANRGLANLGKRNVEAMMADLRRALEIDPNNKLALTTFAKLSGKKKK